MGPQNRRMLKCCWDQDGEEKLTEKGPLPHSHTPPPPVPNRDSVCLPLGSFPSPSLCNSQDGAVPADGLCDGRLTLQHQPARLMVG